MYNLLIIYLKFNSKIYSFGTGVLTGRFTLSGAGVNGNTITAVSIDNSVNSKNGKTHGRIKIVILMEGITIAHLKIVLCLAQIMKVNGLAH